MAASILFQRSAVRRDESPIRGGDHGFRQMASGSRTGLATSASSSQKSDIHRRFIRWRTSPVGLDVFFGRRSVVVARRAARLFLGAEETRTSGRSVRLVGRPGCRRSASPTGAMSALRSKGVSPVWREPGDWIDDSIIFAASTGQYATVLSTGLINQSSIWSVRLASNPWRIEGEPRQLTIASGAETQPSVSAGIGRDCSTRAHDCERAWQHACLGATRLSREVRSRVSRSA